VTDHRIERLAKLLVGYSLNLQEGQVVNIGGPVLAEPLLVELVRAALEVGAVPRIRLTVEGTDQAFLSRAGEEQLAWLSPLIMKEAETLDARIAVLASWNTRELSDIEPARMAARSDASGPALETTMERAARGELNWCVTAFPCAAFAQDADMSLADYEDFVYQAGWMHLADPAAAWRSFADKLNQVAARLSGTKTLRMVAEDTDLTLGVDGRVWKGSYGTHNFPDGEVFTGPVEGATSGDVRFTFPAIYAGREVEDVRLRFEGGRVVKSEAVAGGDLLAQMLALDDGASTLGEFAIGTNYGIERFTKQILFDEKIGGTVHMAAGAGYPETGSQNRSALHWDMVCDMRSGGEIYADGELIYSAGKFLPEFAPDLWPPEA
jgi:aminopeptidase